MTPPKPKLRKRQVDLLLLSIIRAYDHPKGKSEADRLATAREALFGEKRGRGRTDAFDDLALFKLFDEVRKRELDGMRRGIAKKDARLQSPEWEAEIAREPMKVREAARHFSDLAGTSENVAPDTVEHRLRRKARTQFTTKEMAEIESLFDPDAPRTRTIIIILELLESLGVQSDGIWDENT
jgi:hypothetical protein